MTERARPFDEVPHGSLAEEAGKLAEAAQQWLGKRATPGGDDVWADAVTSDPEGHQPECRTCPICRARRLLAGVNPEVIGHVSEAAAALAAAVRAMSSAGGSPGSTRSTGSTGSTGSTSDKNGPDA